jgi:hypothetical protein
VKRSLLIALLAIGLLLLGTMMVLVDRLATWSSSPERSASGTTSPAASAPDRGVAIAPPPAAPPPATEQQATAQPALPPRPIAKPLPRPGVGGGGGPSRLAFEFKMDPRITRSLHMGDRWVSPPTYTIMGAPSNVTVEARARKLGANPPRGKPTWTPTEPDMVDVSPDEGDEVKITVLREGESQLTVSSSGSSKTLLVKATPVRGALRVDITQ